MEADRFIWWNVITKLLDVNTEQKLNIFPIFFLYFLCIYTDLFNILVFISLFYHQTWRDCQDHNVDTE